MFVLSSSIGTSIAWFFIKNWWIIPALIIIAFFWKIFKIPLLIIWNILKLPFRAIRSARAERKDVERRSRE